MPKEAGDKKSKVETYEVVQVTMTMKLYNPIKKSLLVIENQDMPAVSNKIMDKYSPEVMAWNQNNLFIIIISETWTNQTRTWPLSRNT
ncbi:MAG: hypothetical protein AAGF85_01305 [Bacteroidota bacterium]